MRSFFHLFIVLVSVFAFAGCTKGYTSDGNAVYYQYWNEASGSMKVATLLDPKFFIIMQGEYAPDSDHVYCGPALIDNADPASFVVLKYGTYAKDKGHVYFGPVEIQDANVTTFEVVDEVNAKDKYWHYNGEHRTDSVK
jgi:hypothetical protein